MFHGIRPIFPLIILVEGLYEVLLQETENQAIGWVNWQASHRLCLELLPRALRLVAASGLAVGGFVGALGIDLSVLTGRRRLGLDLRVNYFATDHTQVSQLHVS